MRNKSVLLAKRRLLPPSAEAGGSRALITDPLSKAEEGTVETIRNGFAKMLVTYSSEVLLMSRLVVNFFSVVDVTFRIRDLCFESLFDISLSNLC